MINDDEDMVVAPRRTARRCNQCGGNERRVFMAMGCIFSSRTGEGAICICMNCLEKGVALLKKVKS